MEPQKAAETAAAVPVVVPEGGQVSTPTPDTRTAAEKQSAAEELSKAEKELRRLALLVDTRKADGKINPLAGLFGQVVCAYPKNFKISANPDKPGEMSSKLVIAKVQRGDSELFDEYQLKATWRAGQPATFKTGLAQPRVNTYDTALSASDPEASQALDTWRGNLLALLETWKQVEVLRGATGAAAVVGPQVAARALDATKFGISI